MVEIKLPYDKKSIVAKIPDENFAGLLESKAENFHNPLSEEETVERSMDNPIGSPTLEPSIPTKYCIFAPIIYLTQHDNFKRILFI